jgi:hypothetical protein
MFNSWVEDLPPLAQRQSSCSTRSRFHVQIVEGGRARRKVVYPQGTWPVARWIESSLPPVYPTSPA